MTIIRSESLMPRPDYLDEFEKEEEQTFKLAAIHYIENDDFVVDLCSGVGRTHDWIKEVKPDTSIRCIDADKNCVEILHKSGKTSLLQNINYENWTYTYPNPDVITCFGGFNGFVNWSQFFHNLTIAPINILQFNRNDNISALSLYCKEYDYNNYSYISYSEKFIIDLYEHYGFKIIQINPTTISYLVVGSRSH